MHTSATKLLKTLRKRFPNADLDIVRRAYHRAVQAHLGQKRHSGEHYVEHSIEVAQILANLGLDPITVSAALLHDVIEDTSADYAEIAAEFGAEVATMVDGVTKIAHMHLPKADLNREQKQAQNLRKMLVATAKDVRVILIKLADRLHNMRTIDYLPAHKQRRVARETMEIYAPLAHRLGISAWKWELEDHAFRILMPEEFRKIAARVAMKRSEREKALAETIAYLERYLAEGEVAARVIGRPKHLFSIYRKMVRQGKDFDEVMDIEAVRIITQTVGGCYNALGVVHNLWMPVPGRFKDYVAMPKLNMYQAIHTTVMRPGGTHLEVQIRTEEMDRVAREGIAAHWVYKEGERYRDKRLDGQLVWLRQMYEWLKESHSPDDFMDSVRRDFNLSHIYVFTPKGEVFELPVGATALDFAYAVHSQVGHECIGVRANGRTVPLNYHVQMGDQVEILRSKNQSPQLAWLDIVVTGHARTKIRQRLRELGELEPLDESRLNAREASMRAGASLPALRPVRVVDDETRAKLVRVSGAEGLPVLFAKCCDPMPGHAIVGYCTKAHGVTIHRVECKHLAKTQRDATRIVLAHWEGEASLSFTCRVIVGSRPNVLADLTGAIRPTNLDIIHARFAPHSAGQSLFEFDFDASDQRAAERVANTLRDVSGVVDVKTRVRTAPAALNASA